MAHPAIEKALWYKNRIAAMSGGEVVHRAQEILKRKIDRKYGGKLARAQPDHGELPAIPSLRENLLAWNTPAELIAQWEEHARQAMTGEFYLLGQAWPADAADKWHLDPVSGKHWPADQYCFSIGYRHARDMGDVKYVWELGRLQHLQPVAALACKRQDRELARFCLSEVESWIDANPPHQGVHWPSGIELGLRIVSLLVVTTLVGEHLTTGQRTKIWTSLWAHARWLERYPSRFSSANNHLTAEGLGLFAVGALCTAFPEAARWRKHGWELLCETARLQILPDGVGAEQTPNYTAVVLEMLLVGAQLARARNVAMPDYYLRRIAMAGEWLRWLTDEAGNQPFIGDNDNARVIGAYRVDETYVRDIMGSVAAFCSRPDLAPPNARPHLRDALLGHPQGASPAPFGVRQFEEGGYTIARHRTRSGETALLVMDHGYLGYLSIAAHGHADALAVWLHIGGQPVLADAGTYLYHSGGTWRHYFRGTRAHNTLSVEGADQSLMSGHFNWAHKAQAKVHGSAFTGDGWWIEAEQDGYCKRFGVLHRRRLEGDPPHGFTVRDSLSGEGSARQVEIGYLLHPGVTPRLHSGAVLIEKDGVCLVSLRHEGPLTQMIGLPDTPAGGWYSPTFGIKLPTHRIVLSGALMPGDTAVSHFTFGPPA